MEHGLASAPIRWCFDWCRSARIIGVAAWLSLSAFVFTVGCSSPSAKCGRSPPCALPATCLDDGSGSGPSCHALCTQQTECPFNSYCNDGQPHSWCVPSTSPVSRTGAGQWGESCTPACDTANGFDCYGTSPTDANAFCTVFDCSQDSDCPGAWWCATVDEAPNVTTVTRSFGPTRSVCLPRQYCATCIMDHDCARAADGTQQHCVQDSNNSGFCSPQCGSNASCPLDATCQLQWGVCAQGTPASCATKADCQPAEACAGRVCRSACARDADCPPSNGAAQQCGAGGVCGPRSCASDDDCPPTATTFQHCNAGACTPECAADVDCSPAAGTAKCVPLSVCVPRAGACVGNHDFCAPCRSDADCSNGYCLYASYSTERFCSRAMATAAKCSSTSPPPAGSCPMRPNGANYQGVSCTTLADHALSPPNQCVGAVTFGKAPVQFVPGCWTMNR